jgi:hypothetical protein
MIQMVDHLLFQLVDARLALAIQELGLQQSRQQIWCSEHMRHSAHGQARFQNLY